MAGRGWSQFKLSIVPAREEKSGGKQSVLVSQLRSQTTRRALPVVVVIDLQNHPMIDHYRPRHKSLAARRRRTWPRLADRVHIGVLLGAEA
jgi:hypothetical protein